MRPAGGSMPSGRTIPRRRPASCWSNWSGCWPAPGWARARRRPEPGDSGAGRAAQLLVAQLAAEDLADVGGRQAVAELHLARHLVAGEVLAHVIQHLLLAQLGTGLAHHEQLDRLAAARIRHADGRG